ncbi:MAG TPA: aldehyde dehydrogenase family protein [Sphingomonadaceae bacterium]|nr:aldehyde dehydrogenase family protein [Sphingomonadaceae bacterium]
MRPTALVERARAMRVGRGNAPGTEIGPLINLQALNKVEGLIADARADGNEVLAGGAPHETGGLF